MKIRKGFVSNSSSTSFVCTDFNNEPNMKFPDESTIIIPDSFPHGNREFGWDWMKYKDLGSKINYCCLQLLTLKRAYLYGHYYYEGGRAQYALWGMNWKPWFDLFDKILHKHTDKDIIYNFFIEGSRHVEEGDPEYVPGKLRYDRKIDDFQTVKIGIGLIEDIDGRGNSGYIDHQSDAIENFHDMEELFSEEFLEHFLFSPESYIKTGNDNEEEADAMDII